MAPGLEGAEDCDLNAPVPGLKHYVVLLWLATSKSGEKLVLPEYPVAQTLHSMNVPQRIEMLQTS